VSKPSGQTRNAPDGCPIDHKNMSEEELAGLMAQFRKHPSDANQADSAAEAPSGGRGEEDKCPVDHKNMSKEELAGLMATHRGRPASLEKPYNVYGQEIDPANMMPAIPNQLPSPGQQVRLSTDRAPSSIPKSGDAEGTTWTYPSPQMFFNALKRKGKADDVQETDIDSVVAIHNRMNERTWREVLDWEHRFHCDECSNPKLRQFMGKPHELSPAARFRSSFLGYPRPFDRHDWVVDRCGLRDVRYIIDYYYRDDADTGEPIELHVRPALDSPGAMFDRMRHGLGAFRNSILGSAGTSQIHATPVGPPGSTSEGSTAQLAKDVTQSSDTVVDDEEFKFLSTLTPGNIGKISQAVKQDCSKIGATVADLREDTVAQEQANVALNYCMARKICRRQSEEFMQAMESGSGSEEGAYNNMTACLERFHVMSRRVLMQAAGVTPLGPER
jgi:cytochrome c heme-lyase